MTYDDYAGLWAVNGGGRIGLIQETVHDNRGPLYFGEGLDGRAWESRTPQLLCQGDQTILTARRST